MKAYGITYTVTKGGYVRACDTVIDAKDLKSAKAKLAKRHGVKAAYIAIVRCSVVGYF